jgi:hypothetical protein
MGFTFNGLSGAAVTISGGINPTFPRIPTDATMWYSGEVTLSGADTWQTIKTPTAGKRLYVMGVYVNTSGSSHKKFSFDDGTNLAFIYYAANPVVNTNQVPTGNPLMVGSADQVLKARVGANADVVSAWGYEI